MYREETVSRLKAHEKVMNGIFYFQREPVYLRPFFEGKFEGTSKRG